MTELRGAYGFIGFAFKLPNYGRNVRIPLCIQSYFGEKERGEAEVSRPTRFGILEIVIERRRCSR